MHDNWWIWLGIVILFAIGKAWRGLFRSVQNAGTGSGTGMARLNAAAERILKERGASVSNPLPRAPSATRAMQAKSASPKSVNKPARSTSAKPRSGAVLPKSTTPAVIRRSGLLDTGREPVIQRRR